MNKSYALLSTLFLLGYSPYAYAAKWNFEDHDSPEVQALAQQALRQLGSSGGAKKIVFPQPKIIVFPQPVIIEVSQPQAFQAERTQFGYQVELKSDVLFDFDKAELKTEATESLSELAAFLKTVNVKKVIVSGHTDNKGSESYNLNLSRKRADNVAKWIRESTGIASIQIKAFGESSPIADNEHPDGSDNPDGRAKNRRVEIEIYEVK